MRASQAVALRPCCNGVPMLRRPPGRDLRRTHLAALTVALALLLAAPALRADELSLRDVDKQAHVAVSYGLTLTGAAILRRHEVPRWQAVAIAAAVTLTLGAAKELTDEPFSVADQLANGLGAATAGVVVFSFDL